MPLSNGTRLGPYEIVAAIGAGGMGEVYRARDTKLRALCGGEFRHWGAADYDIAETADSSCCARRRLPPAGALCLNWIEELKKLKF